VRYGSTGGPSSGDREELAVGYTLRDSRASHIFVSRELIDLEVLKGIQFA
jgi:hypothetical protein